MRSRAGVLREAHRQLKKRGIPAPEQERLLGLLQSVVASLGNSVIQNEDFTTLLFETLLNNGSLLTVVERQAAELDALKHITRNLTSTLEPRVVLDQVVKEAMYLIEDSHEAHIYLYQDGKLTFGASLDEKGMKNEQISVPRPNGLSFTVVRQKRVTTIADMETDPIFVHAPKPWKGSIICLPLMIGERVVGVMNLVRSSKGEFAQPEIRLLSMLADQAAIAINNADLHQVASSQARIDALTNLPNRRALDERLDDCIRQSNRSGQPFSVIMMDLDGFKSINDNHGHDVGDEVLRRVAGALARSLRSTDLLARYGGDEMTLILPNTDLPQAAHVARNCQSRLRALAIPLPDGETATLSVTGGIALFPLHADTSPGLLRAADEALYRAKKHARGTFMAARGQTGELPVLKSLHGKE